MYETRYRRRDAILFGEIAGDIVALSVERGLCFGMENVTAAVWTLLDRPRSLAEICDALTNDYDVEPERCRSEVASLLGEMEREGLVEAVPHSS